MHRNFSGSVVYITVKNTNKNNPDAGYITQIATAIYDVTSSMAIRFRNSEGKWTPWKYFKTNKDFYIS